MMNNLKMEREGCADSSRELQIVHVVVKKSEEPQRQEQRQAERVVRRGCNYVVPCIDAHAANAKNIATGPKNS